jgi:hypothetical protein
VPATFASSLHAAECGEHSADEHAHQVDLLAPGRRAQRLPSLLIAPVSPAATSAARALSNLGDFLRQAPDRQMDLLYVTVQALEIPLERGERDPAQRLIPARTGIVRGFV